MLAAFSFLTENDGRNRVWRCKDSSETGSRQLKELVGQRSRESVPDVEHQGLLARVREAAAKRILTVDAI
jgi:hypothetical protein